MRDGFAVGGFAGRALHIDVNPLMIAGRVGETVDPLLIDKKPISHAQLLSGMSGQFGRGVDLDHALSGFVEYGMPRLFIAGWLRFF